VPRIVNAAGVTEPDSAENKMFWIRTCRSKPGEGFEP
jgi:hypothetical protein